MALSDCGAEVPSISSSACKVARNHCEWYLPAPTWLFCALQYICQAPRLAGNWTKSQVARSVRALYTPAERARSSLSMQAVRWQPNGHIPLRQQQLLQHHSEVQRYQLVLHWLH